MSTLIFAEAFIENNNIDALSKQRKHNYLLIKTGNSKRGCSSYLRPLYNGNSIISGLLSFKFIGVLPQLEYFL